MTPGPWSASAVLANPLRRRVRRPRTTAELRQHRFYRHLLLWILQTWLAQFYLFAGYTKLTEEPHLLELLLTWPSRVDAAVVQAAGWLEIGLAVGVLSPLLSWTRFRPVLQVAAALLMINALGMAIFHGLEGQVYITVVNLLLSVIAGLVLVGRRDRHELSLKAGTLGHGARGGGVAGPRHAHQIVREDR
ncbi:DoxX family protein [Brevundimonas sp. GCM10030266]|uniref:DoxX family protein n=1 Tax=Brevundimonas sp. GCM10030266 TaxID=3273386 RepID=UPI0036189730